MDPLLWVVVGVVVIALGMLVVGVARLGALRARVGSFECRLQRGADGQWTQGVAHYAVGRIDWWRSRSLALRPARTWSRHELVVVAREDDPDGVTCVVRCTCAGEDLTLSMSKDAYAGLASWLEAGPPPHRLVL